MSKLDAAIDRYSSARTSLDFEAAYLDVLRLAWEAGWRGNRDLERKVYIGLLLVDLFDKLSCLGDVCDPSSCEPVPVVIVPIPPEPPPCEPEKLGTTASTEVVVDNGTLPVKSLEAFKYSASYSRMAELLRRSCNDG